MREPASFSRQRGMAVLAVSVIMLFLITMMTFYANKGSVLEQKMSTNQLQYQQAYEAAQGGMDYSLAWLATASGAASAVAGMTGNSSYLPYNQINSNAIAAPTMGAYTPTVTLWRNSAKPNVIEVNSTSTGDATVKLRQTLNVASLLNGNPLTPLVTNGCTTLGGSAAAGNLSGVSETYLTGAPCSNAGMTGSASPAPAPVASSAWNYAFGMSITQMAALANNTTGPIYYYDNATLPPDPWHTNVGTASSPVILIFNNSNCPTINSNVIIYGTVYCANGGTLTVAGTAQIYGSVITDGAAPTLLGNPTFSPSPGGGNPPYNIPPIVSKITGAWRDF